ncbi:MAG: hypothetical protein WBF71_14055 [Microthrixaceae bacterium]
MTKPWDADALWLKAKLFINHALDDDVDRTDEERALWASLALELLAKSALSRASPLLIAAPTEEGQNLLAASGLVRGDATFKSILAKTLFSRCARAFRPFNAQEATRIADNRNEYLHAATPLFSPIPLDAWWPRYWAQTQVLVNACDRSLEDFVGSKRVASVETALEQNTRNIHQRLDMLIERARQRLARFEQAEMSTRELEDWTRPHLLVAGHQYWEAAECPACSWSDGLIEGDEVSESEVRTEQVSESDFDVWLEIEVGVDHFSCENCRLVLDSYDLIDAAGLPTKIEAIGDASDLWEPDYGND